MYSSMQWIWICNRIYLYEVESWHEWYGSYCTCMYLGQNHLETDFTETDFPNAKTLIWALWLAQKGVFAFGKLVSAKLVSRCFCPKYIHVQ